MLAAMGRYLKAVGVGVDITLNAIFGGKAHETLCYRIKCNKQNGGIASKLPWPNFFLAHLERVTR